jgi:ActR/RegA family two-component response regulator
MSAIGATAAGPAILLVDDDERFLAALARSLRHEGFAVLAAAGGREGIGFVLDPGR